MAINDQTVTDESALDALLSWGGHAFAALLPQRKRVIAWVLATTVAGTAVALLVPNEYTSSAIFIAQGSGALSLPAALQGAAASLGLDRATEYSPKFYADLLASRPVLQSAILRKYQVTTANGPHLESYLEIEGLNNQAPETALEQALKHLSSRVGASADVRTNVITLTVRARSPMLARDIAAQLLTALDSLNVGFRQSQSRGSREFYQTRVLQTRTELDSAEAAVRSFLQQNRLITSPALQFDFQRLQREAERKQSVYAIVVQQYEQARLQEARNVPTLTILSPPFQPVKKSYPPRRLIVFLSALIGLLVVWTQIALRESVMRVRHVESGKSEAIQAQVRHVR
jgi:uncharacterized protein involved in exopolysaccharide biosynthesis